VKSNVMAFDFKLRNKLLAKERVAIQQELRETEQRIELLEMVEDIADICQYVFNISEEDTWDFLNKSPILISIV